MEIKTIEIEPCELKKSAIDFQVNIDSCINSIVEKEGYITYDIVKNNICSNGGNYLGDLYSVDVKGETADGERETAIFIKTLAKDQIEMDYVSITEVYERELFVYKNLSRKFDELQEEADIPENERYRVAMAFDESSSDALFLENVTKRGFRTWYRMDTASLDFSEVCLKELAKLHALSFALEDKNPDYFRRNIKPLNPPMNFGKPWEDFKEKMLNITGQYLDEDIRSRVEKHLEGVLEKYPEYLRDVETKYCLCHGDFRPNNIMFKEVSGKVTEAIPVDYQLIHYGNPVLDFMYFIFTATDYKFRKNHLEYLKNLYYSTFEGFLKHFGLSAHSAFSREVFEENFRRKYDYGLMISLLYVPFVFISEEEAVPELTKCTISDWQIRLDDGYRGRLRGVLDECIEMGTL